MSEIDLNAITPEQFAQLVKAADDQQLADAVHTVGTESVLDQVFAQMQAQFLPEKAQGVDATIQFVVRDEGDEHPYTVRIANGTCQTGRGRADGPSVTLSTDLVNFLKLIAGQANGAMLFMGGKLQVQGDLMLAQRIMVFFNQPS